MDRADAEVRFASRLNTYSKRATLLHTEMRAYKRWRFMTEYGWDPKHWSDADLGVGSMEKLMGDTKRWLCNDYEGNYEEYVLYDNIRG